MIANKEARDNERRGSGINRIGRLPLAHYCLQSERRTFCLLALARPIIPLVQDRQTARLGDGVSQEDPKHVEGELMTTVLGATAGAVVGHHVSDERQEDRNASVELSAADADAVDRILVSVSHSGVDPSFAASDRSDLLVRRLRERNQGHALRLLDDRQ
jgi:hypothetical protein